MTLNTEVVTTTPCDPHEVFQECRRLLGATDIHPFKDEPCDPSWSESGTWEIGNEIGIGLPALMWVVYRPGLEPRRTPEETAAHDEDCEANCDGSDHSRWRPACWVEIHFDTAYGYHGPNGEGCGDLHAQILFDLGQWFDERKIGWGWQNEFTSEWHYEDRYKALKELCSDGGRAMAWFTETVLPVITDAVGSAS